MIGLLTAITNPLAKRGNYDKYPTWEALSSSEHLMKKKFNKFYKYRDLHNIKSAK